MEKCLSAEKIERIVEWNVDVLHRSLNKISASTDQIYSDHFVPANEINNPIFEIKGAISIPVSDPKRSEADFLIEVTPQALAQLRVVYMLAQSPRCITAILSTTLNMQVMSRFLQKSCKVESLFRDRRNHLTKTKRRNHSPVPTMESRTNL
jgi:hypothetical protein